jgi:hypothetical protein
MGGAQNPAMHVFGAMQSTADWQGNAHFPYCRLQWCVPHGTSFWHWNAMGPGTAIWPLAAGAGAGAGSGWAVGGAAG